MFVAVVRCPPGLSTAGADLEVHHEAPAGAGKLRLTLRVNPQDVQRRLSAWLGTLDTANGVAACEHLLFVIPRGEGRPPWREVLINHVEACVDALPANIEDKTGPNRACVFLEQAVLVPDAGLLLVGWAYAEGHQPVQVTYHAEGQSHPVSAQWVRRQRKDVQAHLLEEGLHVLDEPGFVCLVRLPGSQQTLRPGYLRVASGNSVSRLKVPMPTAAEPVRRLIRTLLSNVDAGCSELRRLLDDHVGRAVQATWDRRPPPRSPAQEWQFGPRPASPTVSLIVPLFGRTDLPDYQLALFTDDPQLHEAELIFVMDDPSLLHEFRQRCPELHAMHGLPFTLAYPGDNLGFAGATNHGAALARASLLLLLNSDVFPASPGWLGHMVRSYRRSPDTGLLGVKLLYEDGSLQHAGMESVPFEPWQGLWINRHPHKGLSPHPLGGVQDAKAVTAACVMVDTAFYKELGGLSEDYIIGDFEDSDLCYRARRAGRVCRVDLDVSLYHLERQSQGLGDTGWRTALTLYNCWIHDQRWGKLLQEGTL